MQHHSSLLQLTLRQRARYMRHNPTLSEAKLWLHLRAGKLGVRFRRQAPLLGYIVDFFAPSIKLVVEVDGGYHDQRVALDARRERRLERAGYRVVRVSHQLVVEQPAEAVRVVVEAVRGW